MSKRHIITLLWLAAATILTPAMAQNYDGCYTNLPIELQKVKAPSIPDRRVSITDYGAKGDGQTLCTAAIDEAIAALTQQGGGHVDIPRGVWLTGPIMLDNNIDLHLEEGAILLFSSDKNLFLQPVKGKGITRCVPAISAKRKHDFSITGKGIIDGNGKFWRPVKRGKVSDVEWKDFKKMGGTVSDDGGLWYPYPLGSGDPAGVGKPADIEKARADLFRVQDCQNVMIQGVTVQNSPRFHIHPVECKNFIIDGVSVRCPWNAQNGDAIDLSNVQRALIVNTTVDTGDDGLCMKSGVGEKGLKEGPVSDVLIQNCRVYRAHGGFVLGSDCSGGMRRIVVRDCEFSGTDTGLRFKSGMGRGGLTDSIFISNIMMNGIREEAIVFENTYINQQVGYKPGDEGQHKDFAPDFQGIHIDNMVCHEAKTGIRMTGIEKAHIHDITLKNVVISEAKKPADIVYADRINMKNVTINGVKQESIK